MHDYIEFAFVHQSINQIRMQVVLTLHDTMLTEMYGYWNRVIILHGSLVTEIVAMELCKRENMFPICTQLSQYGSEKCLQSVVK